MTQRYASVFSGAGGLDLGLMRAGLKPGLVTDASPDACAVLRAALPTSLVLQGDVHDLLNAGTFTAVAAQAPPLLVAGQPPLLPGSATGAIDPDCDAPQMLYRFMDAVAQARPEAFIMITMPFLAGPRWGAVLTRLRRKANELGYDTFTPVTDAAEYGVPQRLGRLAFTGMPRGCKPAPVTAFRAGGKVSAGAALLALHGDPVHARTRDVPCPSSVRLAPRPVLRNSPYSGQLLAGPGRMTDLRKPAPALPAALGGNKTPVIDWTQLEFGGVPHIEAYHDYLWRLNGKPEEYRYRGELPGYMRRLSLRECAALQGLPPGYPLRGAPLAQFRLVGSAVPPALAQAFARSVLDGLS